MKLRKTNELSELEKVKSENIKLKQRINGYKGYISRLKMQIGCLYDKINFIEEEHKKELKNKIPVLSEYKEKVREDFYIQTCAIINEIFDKEFLLAFEKQFLEEEEIEKKRTDLRCFANL